MFSTAQSRATQLSAAASAGVLSDHLQAIASLFRTTVPAVDRERAVHLWWLAAFVVGGAAMRFLGLGAVGLHGDEETMAMAATHILIDGRPTLPSGMFYPRGMTQIYLMALSVSIFGESEWALRLPSALCGIGLIPLSYVAGRRFLRPQWNLALAATVAFLPHLIVDSQTARMYIFMVAAITGCMACLFAWERTDKVGWLIGAIAALIVGIDLHALSVAVVLMFFWPGLLRGDLPKLALGAAAALTVTVAFVAIDGWVNAQYPVPAPEFAADLTVPPWGQRSGALQDFALTFDIALWTAGFAIASFALYAARAVRVRWAATLSVILLLAGVGLQVVLFYHLAALAYLAGILVAYRYGSPQIVLRLILLVIAIGLMTLIHGSLLASAPGSFIKLVGAMVGQPSVWPYVRVAQLSEAVGVLTAALLARGLYQLAHRRSVADYWLLAVLSVWIPVFALGLFAWNVPPRYTEMSLAPMLLCAFAFAQRGSDWLLGQIPRARGRAKPGVVAASLVGLCAINPTSSVAVTTGGYRIHPDHKGAAEFMRSQHITDGDIILAEDVLQQTYYLGSVDYWLIGKQVARRYVVKADQGVVVDFYTGTPVVATVSMLDELLQKNAGKRVFVIGSGEGQSDGRRTVRGKELHRAIESDRFETIYVGRDDVTRVLRAVRGAVGPSMSTSVKSAQDADALAADAPPAGGVASASSKDTTPPRSRQ